MYGIFLEIGVVAARADSLLEAALFIVTCDEHGRALIVAAANHLAVP